MVFRLMVVGAVLGLGACGGFADALCLTNPVELGCTDEEREVDSCDEAINACRSAIDCDSEHETFCDELSTCDETGGEQPCLGEVVPDVGSACDPDVDGERAVCIDNAVMNCVDDGGEPRWLLVLSCDPVGGTCDPNLRGTSPGGCSEIDDGFECLILDPAQPELGPLLCRSRSCVGQLGNTPGHCD